MANMYISCTPMGSNWYIARITNSKKVRGGFTANIFIYIYNYIYSSTTTQTLLIFDAFAKQLVFRRMKKSEAFPGSRKANSALIAFHKNDFFGDFSWKSQHF